MARDTSKLRYAETHEWVDAGDDGVATIGISAFAIEQLNDLVYMDLPEVGKDVAVGDEIGEVESVKAVSPLYSPVSGQVVEVHTELPDNLDNLKEDPYEFGWIIKIKMTDASEVANLMDHAAYEKQCSEAG
ncbi:glycine cleavage system protein GcvH [Crateriforma conspicua]|uniref:Glycine cleavage system H protein n=1 Tax=Crateriforma conspicua TaxID=2527996 RepID=A0A5C5Y7B2_9PLAN|nr:glycine cleavage system protein GcvH [Crateriforma conspicua]TWT71200.1 Glycine cleavage system H protein [Crateriforma conspicua]